MQYGEMSKSNSSGEGRGCEKMPICTQITIKRIEGAGSMDVDVDVGYAALVKSFSFRILLPFKYSAAP